MVVVMEERATEAQIQSVVAQLTEMGFDVHRSTGATRTVIGAVGGGTGDPQLLEVQEGVHEVLRITEPYKLASRTFAETSIIAIGDDGASAARADVAAGPCSAETKSRSGECRGSETRRRKDPPRRRLLPAVHLRLRDRLNRARYCRACDRTI